MSIKFEWKPLNNLIAELFFDYIKKKEGSILFGPVVKKTPYLCTDELSIVINKIKLLSEKEQGELQPLKVICMHNQQTDIKKIKFSELLGLEDVCVRMIALCKEKIEYKLSYRQSDSFKKNTDEYSSYIATQQTEKWTRYK